MKLMSRSPLLIFLALILAWSSTFGESTATAFTKCARIANDASRLSCYDRLAADLIELGISTMEAPAATANPAVVAPPVASTPAPATEATAPVAATPAATPAAPASTTTVAAATEPAPQPLSREDSFGFEQTKEKREREVDKIVSRHVGEFTGWDGETEFPLENGQVWQQVRTGRLAWRADSPVITIDRKGFMGAYRLSVEGVNRKIIVRRIK